MYCVEEEPKLMAKGNSVAIFQRRCVCVCVCVCAYVRTSLGDLGWFHVTIVLQLMSFQK